MAQRLLLITAFFLLFLAPGNALAKQATAKRKVTSIPDQGVIENNSSDNNGKKKKVIYKKYTELDFSGSTVQGKVRTPEIFYIFQRKRSDAYQGLHVPKSLGHHRSLTAAQLTRSLPK